MKHELLILSLAFIVVGCNLKADRLELERDVYGSIISHMGGDKAKVLVIREYSTTNRHTSGEIRNNNILDDEAYVDFTLMNKSSTRLLINTSWNEKVQILTKDELNTIFNKSSLKLSWESYYKMFPDSSGIIGLSRVGFNNENNKALVYFEIGCGALCGNGYHAWLSKGIFGWKVEFLEHLWVS